MNKKNLHTYTKVQASYIKNYPKIRLKLNYKITAYIILAYKLKNLNLNIKIKI
jgi:hypothetical protein